MKHIAAKMGVIYSTVVQIVARYKRDGCVIKYDRKQGDRAR